MRLRIFFLGVTARAVRQVLAAGLTLFMLAGCEPPSTADEAPPERAVVAAEGGLVARIDQHTPAELDALMQRAESLLVARDTTAYPDFQPIEFILHGPEALIFVGANYLRYRELVDRAARLDAFGIIDIKVCETWMANNGVAREHLPAFIETVPYGPAVEEQLFRDGYIYF